MPNYSKQGYANMHETSIANEISPYIETIPQQLSRHENRYFIIAILSVLLTAAAALFLMKQTRAELSQTPTSVVNLITQLQNAADEIQLLHEIGELPQTPSLEQLIQLDVNPFAAGNVIEVTSGCFIATKQPHQVRLVFKQQWQVAWRQIDSHEHVTNQALCSEQVKWQAPLQKTKSQPK